jgi:hypothetical protein
MLIGLSSPFALRMSMRSRPATTITMQELSVGTLCGSDETQAHQQGAAQDSCGGQNPRPAELSAIERPDRQ